MVKYPYHTFEVSIMAFCVIFCAAEFDSLIRPLEEEDLIIAADGGLRHTNRLNINPSIILGDFDSLGYVPEGANVFPVEKDDTDAMLAVRKGLELGYREFLLYGSLDGPRLDHTVANFQTLGYLCEQDSQGYLVGNQIIVTALRNGSLRFPAGCTGTISLFCLGEAAEGVTLSGLYYPLEKGTLTPYFPLGVSNHFTGKEAEISVQQGTLLVMWDRENGFPKRIVES